jgi:L-ribulose-5-phosphate 4-epimerase
MELPKRGLARGTFGNVSGIDRDRGVFVIKPSGIPYDELTADMMVVVGLDNTIVEGNYRPSSDTKSHSVLYRNFLTIGGIAHTHSTYSTAWAQANKSIPCLGTTHADYLSTAVPCTNVIGDEQIKLDYETETGTQIIKYFKEMNLSYEQVEMVLVAYHGPFTWGKTPEEAVNNSTILEEIAKLAILTSSINPEAAAIKQTLINKHYLRKHGEDAYYGPK